MPPKLVQVNLRLTETLRARVQEAAENSGRTFAGEVAQRLENSFEFDAHTQQIDARIQRLEASAERDSDTIRRLSLALAARAGGIQTLLETLNPEDHYTHLAERPRVRADEAPDEDAGLDTATDANQRWNKMSDEEREEFKKWFNQKHKK